MSQIKEEYSETGLEIAVIGMAGRFPGAADIEEFWENLKNGVESISFFSTESLSAAGVAPQLLENPDYVKAGGILAGIENFDAYFFGYTPSEARVMDPQIRQFYECCWQALEDAGYEPGDYQGLIGVFAGASENTEWKIRTLVAGGSGGPLLSEEMLTSKDLLSTLISYKLDLRGLSSTIYTTCSTSLVAIHMACRSLLSGECDMVIAGGVSVQIAAVNGYLYREGMMLSPDGHCRAFDAKAKGTLFGSGAGVVVLKTFEDAAAEGDHIYALIKGSAVNNDGSRKVGYTAPSVKGQTEAVRAALQVAEVEAETIGYIEAHGTGTALGDPIEIKALTQAFDTGKKGFCKIGSVKTNIGHLDAASGAASFIKTVLALTHRVIPPSLNFQTPNPEIDFENSPFSVNTGLTQWKNPYGYPLRAGVNSFGFGGTNAHVVLEEAPVGQPVSDFASEGNRKQLILLSAKTESALEKVTVNLEEHLKKNPDINLADAAYTLQVGRKAFEHRRMTVVSHIDEAVEILSNPHSKGLHTFCADVKKRPVIFMFPGPGSIYVNMGLDLYTNEPVFGEEMNRCFEFLKSLLGYDIKEVLYPGDEGIKGKKEFPRPLLFVFEYALAKLLMAWGIEPNAMIGDDTGEYAAACLSGALSLEEALTLAAHEEETGRRKGDGLKLTVLREEKNANAIFVEVGPGKTLTASVRKHKDRKPGQIVLNLVRGPEEGMSDRCYLLNKIGRLWLYGIKFDWNVFYAGKKRCRISLPTYPFESRRYWIDGNSFQAGLEMHARPLLSAAYLEPRDQLERAIADTWKRFFGLDKVGIDDDFFELGGDSLKAMTIIGKFHKELNVKVPLAEFFKQPTVKGIAGYITGASEEKLGDIETAEKKEYYVLSPAQKRLYILQEMEKGSLAYNDPQVVELAGDIKREDLEKTFKELILRHESLRTSMRMVDGEPVQQIHEAPGIDFAVEYYDSSGNDEEQIISRFIRPFDLSQPPFLRSGLIKTGKQQHILMIDRHHIITDGVSHQLLINEFLAIYEKEELPVLRLQYKDYAQWLNCDPQQAGLRQQEAYWLDHFHGQVPLLNLPLDYARPPMQSFEGGTMAFSIGKEAVLRLKELAAAEEATLYMVLLALFNVLLAKISGQEDIVVGIGVAGRRHPDLQNIIGIFVNTLAVRNYPQKEKPFNGFLKEIKESALEAFENQEYPFEELVEKVAVKKDTSRNPLFDVMFMLQNIELETGRRGSPQAPSNPTAPEPPADAELRQEPYDYKNPISKFDLTLFGEERNHELSFFFEYSTKLFKPSTIEAFIVYFKEIAAAAVSNPFVTLREIEAISEKRKEIILHQLNLELRQEAGAFIRDQKTLQQRLEDAFQKYASRTALECGNRTVTFSELNRLSCVIADQLVRKGLKKETFIGVLLENRMDVTVSMLGILRAGCVFVPLDPTHPDDRLESMIRTASIRSMITDASNFSRWSGTAVNDLLFLPSFENRGIEGERDPGLGYSPGDNIYIYFTSGTTGTPRAMIGRNRSLLHFIQWEIDTLGVDESFRFSQLTTPVFDAFLRDVFVPLCAGGVICIPGSNDIIRDSQQLTNWVGRARITVIHCVPGLFRLFNAVPLAPDFFQSLRYILLSGERIEPSDLAGWYHTFGERVRLVNLWGTSETTLAKTCYFIQPSDADRERVPVGRPINGARVLVLDENLEICDRLVTGELYIKTPFRTAGYYKDSALNSQRFIPDPFSECSNEEELLHRTGDLGRILPDGNIDVVGRCDRQVKIQGIRVELEEIESVLIQHPLVIEAAVVKKEIAAGNELLCAYVTVKTGEKEKEKSLLNGITVYLAEKLPAYTVPGKILRIEEMPRKSSGKIDYDALPDPLEEESTRFQPPRNPVEEKVMGLWSEILGIERIGVTSSFFQLGGNSLNIMTLISRLHREFDIRISLAEVFNNATIEKQAAIIRGLQEEERAADKYAAIEAVEKQDYYPQSSAQKRLFFLDSFEGIGTSYNIPFIFKNQGKPEKERYERSFSALIARHEILRTSLEIVGDKPVQRVHPVDELEFAIEYHEVEEESDAVRVIARFIRPFDLSKAPLVRVGFVEIPTGEFLLLFDIHHIVGDGGSMRILVEEFMDIYNGEGLPPSRIQYKDFSLWQNTLFETGGLKTQEDYWLNLYSGEIPRLNLPADYQRPSFFSFEGDVLRFRFDRKDELQFKEFCTGNGVTIFMNLLAALNVLMYKYTGQEDIIIGTSIAGRPHADLHRLIGMFVNELAVRNYPGGEKGYLEFLKEVKTATLIAFDNQDVQFEELVDRLDLERDPSRNPIFDVCLSVANFDEAENRDESENEVRAAGGEGFEYDSQTSKFDITLFADVIGNDIHFRLEYCTSLFKRETIGQLRVHLVNIIRQVIENPGIRISEIDILTGAERARWLYEFNKTELPYPEAKTVYQLFEEQVEKTPDSTAVVGRASGSRKHDVHLTYFELKTKVNRVANYLFREKGIGPENRVGILMDNSFDLIAAILGVLEAGGTYVPIEPSLPEERVKNIIIDAGIGVVVSQKKYIRNLNRLQWECEPFHTFLCPDSEDIYRESEIEKNELMDETLWAYVGKTAVDDITGGGWLTSYTGEPFTREEMDEYGDNILKKLSPLLYDRMRVLEIGCASGISMYRIAPKVGFYYGTDLSPVIIKKNRERVEKDGHQNIALASVPAHEIHRLGERHFDLVILNSVIQSFHGHNYLRQVIGKIVDLLTDSGYIFIGDVMDRDLKKNLVEEMIKFKLDAANKDKNFKTKTDWSSELFVSRSFFEDLAVEVPGIRDVTFSKKIYTIENELTKFRYDCLVRIDKTGSTESERRDKHKYQEDTRVLEKYGRGGGALPCPPASADAAYIIYTSGTTGKPKGVMIEHRSLVNYLCWGMTQYIDDNNKKRKNYMFPLYTPFSFDLTVTSVYLPLISGGSVAVYDNDRFPILEIMKQDEVDVLKTTPSHLKMLLGEITQIGEKKRIKTFIVGGEELERVLAGNIHILFSGRVNIYNEYGPTEATVGSMIYRYRHEAGTGKGVPIGLPIGNTKIYILGRDLSPVPGNAAGEIFIGGKGLARGYVNLPELTAEKFINNPYTQGERIYKTGDLARRLSFGNLEFLGRTDQQVKIRGYRIEINEIENRLLKHDDIKDAVVFSLKRKIDLQEQGLEDEGDAYLCCYWVPEEMQVSVGTAEIKEYLTGHLPDYMVPSYFVQLEKIPLTANGKVNRKALPEPGVIEVDENYVGPGSDVEGKLVEIWSGVLGIEKDMIGIHANFFELGGHSLRATILVSRIHKELNVKIPLAEVFKTPTIEGLARYIACLEKDIYEDIIPVEKREYYSQSSAQKRLFFLDQFEDIGTSYNMPEVINIRGKIERERYENSFKALIARHDALRTSFELIRSQPVQRIHDRVDFQIEEIRLRDSDKSMTVEQRIAGAVESFIRPFDLSKAPLLRSGLMKISEAEYLLLFDMHHIVGDGTSMVILTEDFAHLFRGKELKSLKVQYKDFTQWQNNLFKTGRIQGQEKYWLDLYADFDRIPVLNLPTDYPREDAFCFEGAAYYFRLDAEDTGAFRKLADENGATLYMNLLAVFNVLLYIYTGQSDIIVGSGIAGRPHTDLQNIIGMFVNTLALRNYPEGEKTYVEFLDEVKCNCVKAFENQDMQFEELVERVCPGRTTLKNPIFSVELNVQNYDPPALGDQPDQPGEFDASFTLQGYERTTSKFDVIFFATEVGDTVEFMVEYSTALFKPSTIEKMAQRYLQILKQVVENKDLKLKEIKVSYELLAAAPTAIQTEFRL